MKQIILALAALSFFTAYSVFAAQDPDADYDRLDGTGASHEKVQVIEWEGNLEVHVYPKGSLVGLGLKLDKRDKDKPVMVISYRFGGTPLIRRAILGINLKEGFKTFKDPTEEEFDKIVISNDGQDSPVVAFRLDPTPTQLYPDGYDKALEKSKLVSNPPFKPSTAQAKAARVPAEDDAQSSNDSADSSSGDTDSDGGIKPFFTREAGRGNQSGR